MEESRRGRKTKWSEEKEEIICKAIAQGKSYKDAYTAARISYTAFYAHLKSDNDFFEKVKKAEKEYQKWYDLQLVTDCKRSLRELICGFEYDEVTTESGTDWRTGKAATKTKIVKKRVLPNVTAIIFALCNRDPENWKNRVEGNITSKVDVESKQNLSLASVPDELLEKVIDAISGKLE